jgi:hypothetical protein
MDAQVFGQLIQPGQALDPDADFLCLDLDALGFQKTLDWLNSYHAVDGVLPGVLVAGSPPPPDAAVEARANWTDQVRALIQAGAVFQEKELPGLSAPQDAITRIEQAMTNSLAPAVFQEAEGYTLPGDPDRPAVAAAGPASPPTAGPADGGSGVDLSLYAKPPFQLTDADFEEILKRSRGPLTERED